MNLKNRPIVLPIGTVGMNVVGKRTAVANGVAAVPDCGEIQLPTYLS